MAAPLQGTQRRCLGVGTATLEQLTRAGLGPSPGWTRLREADAKATCGHAKHASKAARGATPMWSPSPRWRAAGAPPTAKQREVRRRQSGGATSAAQRSATLRRESEPRRDACVSRFTHGSVGVTDGVPSTPKIKIVLLHRRQNALRARPRVASNPNDHWRSNDPRTWRAGSSRRSLRERATRTRSPPSFTGNNSLSTLAHPFRTAQTFSPSNAQLCSNDRCAHAQRAPHFPQLLTQHDVWPKNTLGLVNREGTQGGRPEEEAGLGGESMPTTEPLRLCHLSSVSHFNTPFL
jgi:hypothetical protein